VLEDDMEYSYDFLHYFEKTAPLLDSDPSLMCISSWNDNCRKHLGSDASLLLRTSYFPGLGWMMKREMYTQMLQPNWPMLNHWDNWLRANVELDCISPSLSRNHNFGVVGSTMSSTAFAKNIANVDFYKGDERVQFGDLSYLHLDNYKLRIQQLLDSSFRLSHIAQKSEHDPRGMIYLLVYQSSKQYRKIAKHFKIWDHPRSHFQNLQMLELQGDIYLLADVRFCPLLPKHLRTLRNSNAKVIAGKQGLSCDDVCKNEAQMRCSAHEMAWLNRCVELKSKFECEKGCLMEVGKDIPSYVSGDLASKGYCVIQALNSPMNCDGHHSETSRLCACL